MRRATSVGLFDLFVCLFVCFVASQTVWNSALEGALDERRRSYLNEGGDGGQDTDLT